MDNVALSVVCKTIGKENTQSKKAFQNHVYAHSIIKSKKPRKFLINSIFDSDKIL